MEVQGKKVKLQIWDTAGQERFKNITASYYRGGNGVLVVYDITDRDSFENLNSWLIEIEKNASKNVYKLLIGNKSDLEDKREIPFEQGQQFAEENNLTFYETSALNGNNIEEIFVQSATDLVTKLENGEYKDNFENTGIKIYQYPNQDVENIATDKKINSCC